MSRKASLGAAAICGLLALGASAAVAANPTATTLPAISVERLSADICGRWTRDLSSQLAFTQFDWGTSTSYGEKANRVTIDTAHTSDEACAALLTLTPGTRYHYRFNLEVPVSGNNCPCSAYSGADGSFTTQAGTRPVIVGPTTVYAGQTHTDFTLHSQLDGGGYGYTWKLLYGTNKAALSKSTPSQYFGDPYESPIDVHLGELTRDATYYWQIVATNPLGTTRSAVGSIDLGAPQIFLQSGGYTNRNVARVCASWSSDHPGFLEAQWGPTTKYGSVSTRLATSYGQTAAQQCIDISGLQASTAYHYRLLFLLPDAAHPTSCPCTDFPTADATFTTLPGARPNLVGPTSAVHLTAYNEFTVQTRIDADGYYTTWQVLYGTSPSDLNHATPAQPIPYLQDIISTVSRTITVTKQRAGTSVPYYWRVTATNRLGTAMSAIKSIKISAPRR